MKSKNDMHILSHDIALRQLCEDDAEDLALLADDRSVWENLRDSTPLPYTYHDALGFIHMCLEEDKPISYGIFYGGKFAGMAGLMPGKDVNRITCDVGYWVGEPYRGNGMATVALRGLIKYALEEFGFYKLTACVFEGNLASIKVLEKCGFEREAVLQGNAIKAGKIIAEWRFAYFHPKFDIKMFDL